ncbi:MAG: hypothetical protein AAF913_05495 [Pseudomonadota bacterium]
MTGEWTDEEIAAYVDGSIDDPALAARLGKAIETDPALSRRVEAIKSANALLRRAFDDPMAEPIPTAIEAALMAEPGRVAVLPRRRAPFWAPAAMAASLALCLGLGGGWYLATEHPAPTGQIVLGASGTSDALAQALETLPTGTASPAGIRPILTFRDGAGRACREFETVAQSGAGEVIGIACRLPDGLWSVQVAAAVTEPTGQPNGGFTPASAMAGDVLSAVLDALEAGPALRPSEEMALIQTGWRSP